MGFDNQILVATGIGITPILSTARAYMYTRRVNMIWIVREPDVLEFFLEQLSLNTSGWLMAFYTGRKPLSPLLEEYWSHTNVRIIKGRPDMNVIIPGLIYGIESGVGLPETSYNEKKQRAIEEMMNLYTELDMQDDHDYLLEEAFALARKHGFQLTALIQEMEKKNMEDADPHKRKYLSQRLSDVLSSSYHGDEMRSQGRRGSAKASRRPSTSITEVFETYKLRNSGGSSSRNFTKMKRRGSNRFQAPETSYEPWKANDIAPDYVKKLEKPVLESWGLVFCGRNAIVSKMLHKVTEEYDIDMFEERYEW